MGDWLPGVLAKPKRNQDCLIPQRTFKGWNDTVTHDEISFHPQQLDKVNVNHLNAEPGSNCHVFHQSSQYHMLGQIKSLWGKRWGLELSTEPCIPPPNSLPNGGQNLDCKLVRKEAGPRAQHRTLYFTSQHSTTRKLAQKRVRKEAGLRTNHRTLCSTSHHSTTHRSDWKFVRKEAGLRTHHRTLCSTSHHSTTHRSDWKFVRKEAGLRTHHRTLCSTSHHSTTHRSDWRFVRKEAGLRTHHRTLCSTSHHSTTHRSDWKFVRKEVGLRTHHRTLCCISQHSTTQRSDWILVRKELSTEPSPPLINILPWGSQLKSFVRKEAGLRAQCGTLYWQSDEQAYIWKPQQDIHILPWFEQALINHTITETHHYTGVAQTSQGI